jgi:hypothetical protein
MATEAKVTHAAAFILHKIDFIYTAT